MEHIVSEILNFLCRHLNQQIKLGMHKEWWWQWQIHWQLCDIRYVTQVFIDSEAAEGTSKLSSYTRTAT
jgi:hypothetical protein